MNEPSEIMYCSFGGHWTESYINYFTNYGGICEDCANAVAKEEGKMEEELLSECCGAESTVEIIDGLGICAECKEHAEFIDEDESCNEGGGLHYDRDIDQAHLMSEARKLK